MTHDGVSRRIIVIDPSDNVATALIPLVAGESIDIDGRPVALAADIPRGHKFALRPIAAGQPILKYGQPIGLATAPIAPGHHVHVHNCASRRAGGPRRHGEREEGKGQRAKGKGEK